MDGLVSTDTEKLLTTMNFVFTMIFAIEMCIKLYGLGVQGYVSDNFNTFDGIVVILSLIEIMIESITASNSTTSSTDCDPDVDSDCVASASSGTSAISAFRAIRIFRTFRVLRVSRILRGLQFMQVIVDVVGGAIEQFMYIALLLC